jgi:Dimerisation domain of Zinc Transporter
VGGSFSCGLIIFNGVGMLRASIDEVLDAQAAPELVAEILTAVQAVPGVTSVEKCRVRKSGFARFADIHVRVSGDCTVREGHDIAHLVKNSLLQGNFHWLTLLGTSSPRQTKALRPSRLDRFARCGDQQVARFRAEDGELVFRPWNFRGAMAERGRMTR